LHITPEDNMQKKDTKLRDVSADPTATLDMDVLLHHTSSEELEEWKIDGIIYAALLGHPKCPEAFRKAFVSVFTEHLFNECQTDYAPLVRILFPLVVGHLQGQIPAEAYRAVLILRTLRETLAPDLTKEIQEKLEGEGLEMER
jgi:hypothetical protein